MHDPPRSPAVTGPLDTEPDFKVALAQTRIRARHHFMASQAADHLAAAARLLREVPGRDAILLAAPRTADVLSALRNAAPYEGAMPSFDLRDAIDGLRTWPLSIDDHGPERPHLDHHHKHNDQKG